MANGIDFKEANAYPGGEGYYTLATWQGRDTSGTLQSISKWQFSAEEIEYIKEHGHCFLRVLGGQPPVQVFAGDPFRDYTIDEIIDILQAIPAEGFVCLNKEDDQVKRVLVRRVAIVDGQIDAVIMMFTLARRERMVWVYDGLLPANVAAKAFPLRLYGDQAVHFLNIPFDDSNLIIL